MLAILIGLQGQRLQAQTLVCSSVAGDEGSELRTEYDVVVVGAGTGGLGAAMQATRLGASVLLVEATDWVGGQMAAAGVTSMDEGYPPRRRVRQRGVYSEFCDRARAYYRAIGKSTDTPAVSQDHFGVEPNIARRIFLEMIRDTRRTPLPEGKTAVLDLLLRAEVVSVQVRDDTVTGVTIEGRRGDKTVSQEVRCKLLIDATEYGDVIPLTGARYRVGTWQSDSMPTDPEQVPPVQPITWTAVIRNYGHQAPDELLVTAEPPMYRPGPLRHSLAEPGSGTSERPWSWKRFLQYRGMPDSTNPFGTHNGSGRSHSRTHVNFWANDQHMDILCVEDLDKRAQAEYEARLLTLGVLYYVHTELKITSWSVANDVGYDSPYNREQNERLIAAHPDLEPYREVLKYFPVIPYVRESRRIVGIDVLTAKQIRRKAPFEPEHFPTAVAMGDYPVDVHGEHVARELQVEYDLDDPEDLPERWIQWGYGPFQIPFGSFIPEKVDGFLVAEKNLSQSRLASGATRLQPSTMLTGQASGAIAGLACQLGVEPREVPPVLVQQALLDAGSTLSMEEYDDLNHGTELWKQVQLTTLYNVFQPEGSEFKETRKLRPEEIEQAATALGQLAERSGSTASFESPLDELELKTRADLATEAARRIVQVLTPSTDSTSSPATTNTQDSNSYR